MLFGTDKTSWAQVSKAAGPLATYRAYNPVDAGPHGVPASWPGTQAAPVPPGVMPIVSFHPNVHELLKGHLDEAIVTYLRGAPDISLVTAWHECNLPGSMANAGASPEQFVAAHAYLRDLAAQEAPNVLVGAIYGTWRIVEHGEDLAPFVCPGLAWYGLDGYQHAHGQDPEMIFGDAWQMITVAEPHAQIGITETNSRVDQATWFPAAYQWAAGAGSFLFEPFFGGNAGNGGVYPFDPADDAAVAALKVIGQACRQA